MPGVPTRWKCDECGNVCSKRPHFNYYMEGRKNAVDFFNHSPEAKLLCTECRHPANKHGFTFEALKEKQ